MLMCDFLKKIHNLLDKTIQNIDIIYSHNLIFIRIYIINNLNITKNNFNEIIK